MLDFPQGTRASYYTQKTVLFDVDGDGRGDLLGYTMPGAFDPPANEPAAVSLAASPVTAVPGSVDVCAAIEPLPTMTVTGTGFALDDQIPIYVISRMPSGATVGVWPTHLRRRRLRRDERMPVTSRLVSG